MEENYRDQAFILWRVRALHPVWIFNKECYQNMKIQYVYPKEPYGKQEINKK